MAAPSLADRLRAAMNEARKQRDQARTLLLSTILSDIKNREIELNRTPTDDETGEVLRRGIKKRRESVEVYEKVGRTEAAATETAEIKALEAFLPAAMAPEEIRAAVREAIAGGAKDLGKVMGAVMPKLKGRADGSIVFTSEPSARPLSFGMTAPITLPKSFAPPAMASRTAARISSGAMAAGRKASSALISAVSVAAASVRPTFSYTSTDSRRFLMPRRSTSPVSSSVGVRFSSISRFLMSERIVERRRVRA